MAASDQRVVAHRSGPLTGAVFYLVCALLLPAMIAGYSLWIAKLYGGRKSKVSGTAQGPLSARWMQHRLGTRSDEPASRLLMALPSVSRLAVWLVFGPMLVANRASGFVPRTFRYPFQGEVTLRNQASARQTFYDGAVDRYLPEVTQFVILGAGFDTRALRLPNDTDVRSFEVETPETLAVKQAALRSAGIAAADIVTFVAADFEHQDWFDRLTESGFDPDRRSLFLWEGVTPYLEREAIEGSLRKIASVASNSVVAFDYMTTEALESRSLALRLVRASLQAGGEPLKFGIDATPPTSERVAELLRSCGLSVREQHTIGQESGRKRALGGFAIAAVP